MYIISNNVDRPHGPETEPLWFRVLWVVVNFCVFVVAFVIFYIIALAIMSPKHCKFDITKTGFDSVKLFDNNTLNLNFWMEGFLRNPEKRTSAEVHGIRMEVLSQNIWSRQLIISPPGTNFHLRKGGGLGLGSGPGG